MNKLLLQIICTLTASLFVSSALAQTARSGFAGTWIKDDGARMTIRVEGSNAVITHSIGTPDSATIAGKFLHYQGVAKSSKGALLKSVGRLELMTGGRTLLKRRVIHYPGGKTKTESSTYTRI